MTSGSYQPRKVVSKLWLWSAPLSWIRDCIMLQKFSLLLILSCLMKFWFLGVKSIPNINFGVSERWAPRVKRNNEVDIPQERPPCRKCGKLHGGECMMGTNACYYCGKPGHMVKDCPSRRSQEQGKERVQPNSLSEEAPRRQWFFALKSRGAGEGTSGEVSGE